MSKATKYLVGEIENRDRIIASLLSQQLGDRERYFDEGWHAYYLETERTKADPLRPFTKQNPYAGTSIPNSTYIAPAPTGDPT
ncbi:MAG: hypothetical protein ABIP33_06385 [Pseudolysinimonas sp.]